MFQDYVTLAVIFLQILCILGHDENVCISFKHKLHFLESHLPPNCKISGKTKMGFVRKMGHKASENFYMFMV